MKKLNAFVLDDNGAETKVSEEATMTDATEQLVLSGKLMNDDEGIFFQRQLEYIQAESYDVLYPDLMGRIVFPTNNEGGEGIQTITYRSYDKRGETAIIAGKATDLPRADISGREYTISVKTFANAYGYSRQEIASAQLVGLPLDARKAEAGRRSYEEKINQVIWFGDVENNLHGFFGGPVGAPCLTVSKTQVAAAAAGGNSRVWGVDKTPTEVIADLTDALASHYSQTLKLFKPDTILMSVEKKLYLQNTARSDQSDMSILSWFLANNSFIKSADQIKDINELDGIYDAAGGAFAEDNSKGNGFTTFCSGSQNARAREPFPLVHLPVQYEGLEFVINCYGRFAGVEMVRPAAFQHFYGV
ncbi:MAG: DUF2184 domain-containing protein [Gammaproteobacteria bacterium]|nr:DUF2184 domain-containing protein [Gammaproteobacteria bacterium]